MCTTAVHILVPVHTNNDAHRHIYLGRLVRKENLSNEWHQVVNEMHHHSWVPNSVPLLVKELICVCFYVEDGKYMLVYVLTMWITVEKSLFRWSDTARSNIYLCHQIKSICGFMVFHQE